MSAYERQLKAELLASAASYPVVTLVGPRQSGKSTLVKEVFPDKAYVNLEDPDVRNFAQVDPREFLANYPQGAIIDEIQRVPELLSYIQGIVDETQVLGMYVLTGSHQLALQEEVTQSLAGRTALLHLMPLSLDELKRHPKPASLDALMYHGFYPRIYKYGIEPQRFYRDYVRTYIERDVRKMLQIKDLDLFQRFLTLCATRIGQLIDYTDISNALGISRHTVNAWISLLKASFIVTTLQPYSMNLGKRLVKSPKLYFNDTGLVSYLLGIRDPEQLAHHPMRGYLFENFIVSEVNKFLLNCGEEAQLYFYRDHHQLEVDLVFQYNLKTYAIEIKSSSTFHKQFLKGVKQFMALSQDSPINIEPLVVYTGVHEQRIEDVQVVNYKNLTRCFS